MGHRSKEKIDASKFRRTEAYKIPAGPEWHCLYNDTHIKIYLSEAWYREPYTIVGVCDADDKYIRKQYNGHNNIEAQELFEKLLNMEIIFSQNLYDLGMVDD